MRPLQLLGRALLAFVTTVLGIVAVAAIVVAVLSMTPWGHERVRRLAVSQLSAHLAGKVAIGSVSGNLLQGFTLHDLAITDSAGRPFLAAEAVSADYGVGSLVRKRIYLDNVTLTRPVVVLDRPPGGAWNYQVIFKMDTTKKAKPSTPSWGSWIKLTDVRVRDGLLTVRTPWKPSEGLKTQAARDSAIQAVLTGQSRLMVQRVPNGFQKVVQLRSLNADLPLLRLADPSYQFRLAQVSALSMEALPFRPPAARVTAMRGNFEFDNDSLWWKGVQAQMPQSRISGDGSYVFSSGDMNLKLHGAPAALADLQWLYPRLPSQGHGTLDFLMQWRGAAQDYVARNADIAVGDARVAGNFGLTLTDTFTIHDTDLRVANLDTRLLEQLIPHLQSPQRGVISGNAIVSGGKHALLVNGDVAFSNAATGTSRLAAAGEVGFLTGGLRARDLRLRAYPVQVELARKYMPTLPISGTVSGTAYVNGSTNSALAIRGDITHADRGAVSRLAGTANIRLAGGKYFDVNARAEPISLAEVGRFMPSAGLQGAASGPLHVRGTLAQLHFDGDLRLPDGGAFVARGTADLASPQKGYAVTGAVRVFNLNSVVAKAPRTSLTGQFAVNGRGFAPATMRTSIAADFGVSRWDSLAVDTASVRVAIANGMLQAQRIELVGSHAAIGASGTFGLVAGRSGKLDYRVAVDSLGALNRWLPRTAADTGFVQPRPARVVAALAKARADSARIADSTEVERAVTGKPMPRIPLRIPQAVPRDTVSGSLLAAGTITGNLQNFDLRGRLGAENLVVRGYSANRLRAEYAWNNARTPDSQIALAVQGDTITAAGFAFDSLDARLAYKKPGGRIEVVVLQGNNREYALLGDFTALNGTRELRISNVSLQFDTAQWHTTHPAVIRSASNGITVENLELRDRGIGRIYANGLLPTQGVASFRLEVDNLEIADVTDLLQSDIRMSGRVAFSGAMAGTLANPSFHGAFGLVNGTYQGSPVPELHGTFAYAGEQLTTHLDMLRDGGATLAVADARLPVNLALQGVTGSRLLDRPMTVDFAADSLPLDLIPHFTDAVSEVQGTAVGRIAMRGTLTRPVLVGVLAVNDGQMVITQTGMRITNIAASVRMLRDSVYVDSIAGRARGPVSIRGVVAVGSWRNPTFDLHLVANDAEVMNSDLGRLRADAGLALTGPFDRAYVSGKVTVTQGAVYTHRSNGNVISAGDPALFNVVDTTDTDELALVAPPSPLIQNLRMDVQVAVNRNTWVRSRDGNVEIYTEYPITVRYARQQLSLLGSVSTDRGEYTFMSKRFQVERGSAMFTGGRELNPLLQIAAEYDVTPAGQPTLHINVLVGGTLRHPNVQLTSDAQPPKSQSELLSYLAFGRSTTSLLDFSTGSSVSSLTTSGDLVGFGAQLAVRRLAAVAVGVAANELQTQAGRALGADVLNVTPADVPPELLQGHGITNFLRSTQIEAGKYINPRTYVGLQSVAQYPGAQLQYRTGKGWLYEISTETRILPNEPTLSSRGSGTPVPSFGLFAIRHWRF